MKKFLALAFTLIMVLSLAACGGNEETPSGNNENPSSSQQPSNTPDEGSGQSGSEIFDVDAGAIRAVGADLVTTLSGDEREAMISKIPDEIMKGIGEVTPGLGSIGADSDGGYILGFQLTITDAAQYETLVEYYKSLGGTVTDEFEMNDFSSIEMDFSWGNMYQCEYRKSSSGSMTIDLGFHINE